jgi:hypothetical protein
MDYFEEDFFSPPYKVIHCNLLFSKNYEKIISIGCSTSWKGQQRGKNKVYIGRGRGVNLFVPCNGPWKWLFGDIGWSFACEKVQQFYEV